jgi:hypothetical protein
MMLLQAALDQLLPFGCAAAAVQLGLSRGTAWLSLGSQQLGPVPSVIAFRSKGGSNKQVCPPFDFPRHFFERCHSQHDATHLSRADNYSLVSVCDGRHELTLEYCLDGRLIRCRCVRLCPGTGDTCSVRSVP